MHSSLGMVPDLVPALVLPSSRPTLRAALAGVACAATGALLALALRPAPTPVLATATVLAEAAVAPAPRVLTVPVAVPVLVPTPVEVPSPAGTPRLVVRAASTSFVALAELGDDHEAIPRHGKLRRGSEADGADVALAEVAVADVPLAYRGWLGAQVTVDGACTARVTGFAVVARLVGEPGYAGLDAEAWSAASILEHGSKVLAARLDRCDGVLAIPAGSPAIALPAHEDPALVARAHAALLRTDAARAAAREFAEGGEGGRWYEHATVTSHVVTHPATGATFVAVQLRRWDGCGAGNFNVWGVYRVGADGALAAVPAALGEVDSVERLLDVDGDGAPEVLGRTWLATGAVLARLDGTVLARAEVPFFGCPC